MRNVICMATEQCLNLPLHDRIKYFLLTPGRLEKDCTCKDCTPRLDKKNYNDHHHHHHHVPHMPRAPQMILPSQEEIGNFDKRPVSWQRVTNVFLFGVIMLFILITKR